MLGYIGVLTGYIVAHGLVSCNTLLVLMLLTRLALRRHTARLSVF